MRCLLPRPGPATATSYAPRATHRVFAHRGWAALSQWARVRLPAPGPRGGAGVRRSVLTRGGRWGLLDPDLLPGASSDLSAGRDGAGLVPSRTEVPRSGGAAVPGTPAAGPPPPPVAA